MKNQVKPLPETKALEITKIRVQGDNIVGVMLSNGRTLGGIASVQYVEKAFTNQQTGETKGGIQAIFFASDDLEIDEVPDIKTPTLAEIKALTSKHSGGAG